MMLILVDIRRSDMTRELTDEEIEEYIKSRLEFEDLLRGED